MALLGFTPTWFNRLPQFRRGDANWRVVIVDNQVLSYRLLDGLAGPVFDFLFQDARVIVQIARQVIDGRCIRWASSTPASNWIGADDRGGRDPLCSALGCRPS